MVRQALRELELEDLIYRRKGKGSYVSEPKIGGGLAQKLTGFYHDMEERGHNPISQILRQTIIPASTKIAQQLEINPGTPVIELQRLRFVQNEPIVLVTSYLPHVLCPGLEEVDLRERSLYEYLETSDVDLEKKSKEVEQQIQDQEDLMDLLTQQILPGTSSWICVLIKPSKCLIN